VNEAKFTLRIGWRQVLAQMSFGVLIAALTLLDALAIEQLIEGRADAWMVLPALLSAVLVVMLARANGSWLAVPKAWIAGMLAGLARPFIRIELVGIETGGGAREIVAIMRIGRFRRTQWRIPAGAVRSVRWEPDSGSPSAKPRKEWLVLLDMREDVPPEFAQFKQASRRLTDQFGLRAAAMAIAKTREGAERDGMRLIAFLESCGLRLEPDPNPERENPRDEQRAAPPTSPEGIGQIELSPARAAAARERVRWVLIG
jgi:hypothetical protein